jgi:hypothetical protein
MLELEDLLSNATCTSTASCARVVQHTESGASTGNAVLLENEGPFDQGWRPVRTFGESVGGIFETGSYDWSNGIRYHIRYQT